MKIIIDLAIAATRGETIRSILTSARRAASESTTRFAGTSAPLTPEEADEATKGDLLQRTDEPLGTPREAVKERISQIRRSRNWEEHIADMLVEITVGARKMRDWMDELEVTAGRAARAYGVSARRLAQAIDIAERNAAKRYRLIPGEGWTSIR